MTDIRTPLDVACHLTVLGVAADGDGLIDALQQLSNAGYRRAVIPPMTLASSAAEMLISAVVAAEIQPIVSLFQLPGANIAAERASERTAGAKLIRDVMDFASQIGADHLTGVPYGLFGAPDAATPAQTREAAARTVGELADEAHERGMILSLEVVNRYETSMINTAAQAMAFANSSGSDHVRIHLDTFHMAIEEKDMRAAIRVALPRLAFLELGQSSRGPLTEGVVDIPGLISAALDEGYDGRFGVEAFSRPLMPPAVADALRIWATPYGEAADVVHSSMKCISQGWRQSEAGRRAGVTDTVSNAWR